MTRVAINGFGRIGRNVFKAAFDREDIEFVGINDLTDSKTLAYLLKHDTVYGMADFDITYDENHLIIDGKKIPVTAIKNPAELPWKKLKVDIVLECTGIFLTRETASGHLEAGAKRVLLSAPAKDDSIPTYLLGVNAHEMSGEEEIISNASCTTNCIAPVMNILKNTVGVEKTLMTTVHAYTAKQALQDSPSKDVRRGRAAAMNMIPTTTGAAIATTKVIPEIEGCFDGMAIRVPVQVGSLSDFTIVTKRDTTVEEINQIFRDAAASEQYEGIVFASEEHLVSSDFVGNPYSSIIDLPLTKVVDGNLVKVLAWYDNEWGYSNRLADMAALLGSKL